jgi:hypothetical protein
MKTDLMPHSTRVDFYYECPSCKHLHILYREETRHPFRIECHCDEVFQIKPLSDDMINVTFETKPLAKQPTTGDKSKALSLLLAQGYTKQQVGDLIDRSTGTTLDEIMREVLANVSMVS